MDWRVSFGAGRLAPSRRDRCLSPLYRKILSRFVNPGQGQPLNWIDFPWRNDGVAKRPGFWWRVLRSQNRPIPIRHVRDLTRSWQAPESLVVDHKIITSHFKTATVQVVSSSMLWNLISGNHNIIQNLQGENDVGTVAPLPSHRIIALSKPRASPWCNIPRDGVLRKHEGKLAPKLGDAELPT